MQTAETACAGRPNATNSNLRYTSQHTPGWPMGELMDVSGGLEGGFGLISGLVSLVALGIYALTQGDTGNDDDDSSPGGGLMQPVGGSA
jgi:hypothetical protein